MIKSKCIIFCNCSANVVLDDKKKELISSFKKLQIDVIELNDLCAFAVHQKSELQEISLRYQQKIIVACYPRAIQNMFKQFDIDFGDFDVINFRTATVVAIRERLTNNFLVSEGNANYSIVKTNLEVPAWYPIVDQSRCTQCGKCAKFCLFGVYSFKKNSLEVVSPLSCKNLCPACGRTCPSQAIIFPRLKENSTLSGADVATSLTFDNRENSNLLVMLTERNQNRRSILKESVVHLAEEERKNALEERSKMKKKGE